jgi:hypothetical protein
MGTGADGWGEVQEEGGLTDRGAGTGARAAATAADEGSAGEGGEPPRRNGGSEEGAEWWREESFRGHPCWPGKEKRGNRRERGARRATVRFARRRRGGFEVTQKKKF